VKTGTQWGSSQSKKKNIFNSLKDLFAKREKYEYVKEKEHLWECKSLNDSKHMVKRKGKRTNLFEKMREPSASNREKGKNTPAKKLLQIHLAPGE